MPHYVVVKIATIFLFILDLRHFEDCYLKSIERCSSDLENDL